MFRVASDKVKSGLVRGDLLIELIAENKEPNFVA